MKESIVSVDCCTSWAALGLAEDGVVRGEMNVDAGRRQAEILPAMYGCLLESCSRRPEEVDLYGLIAGPGSFTGIKVGISFVTFLAWAGGKKVVPLSSLECMAFERIGRTGGVAAIVLQGGGGRICGGLFTSKGGLSPLTRLMPDGAYSPADFMDAVSAVAPNLKEVQWMTDRPEKTGRQFGEGAGFFVGVRPSGAAAAILAHMRRQDAIPPDRVRAEYLRDPDTGA